MSYECVLKCGKACKATETISDTQWKSLKTKSEKWNGLDRFGDVYITTPWDEGSRDRYMHQTCYLVVSSLDKLAKAQRRKEKENETISAMSVSTDSSEKPTSCGESDNPLPPKRLRSSVSGSLHDKTKCVWCMKVADTKHPNRRWGKLYRINTFSAWRSFQNHTVYIEDPEMRARLTRLVESTSALSDPFANDISYHYNCWQKYVSHPDLKAEDAIHLQNVCLSEARNLFFKHVDSVIFDEHEIRTLQSLLDDYKRIVGDYGYSLGDVKSSHLKQLLQAQYKERIGFRERCERNKSEWVYDVGGGGDYIEAVTSSLGISDEQLLQNLAKRLSNKIKSNTTVPWPPHINSLEEGEEISELLLKLLTWLKQPTRKAPDLSPRTLSLASMITHYITGKPTTTVINLGITIHGMTRSKDLLDILHKSGICISYSDTLFLYDHWALMDITTSQLCPQEIADGKPAIVIVDNDDFKIDTITGNADGAHRTNVLFVQPESLERKAEYDPDSVPTKKKDISQQLKERTAALNKVHQYRCPPGSKSEPTARARVDPPVNGTTPQRIRSVIHTLSRADKDGTRPTPEEQQVPAYGGAQSCCLPSPGRSKPYYHTTYPEPPSKSVLHDIMLKLTDTMCLKDIPFSFLVGDMPTYKTIVQLKAENPEQFNHIVPILGAFHQQMSYIYAIYKRFLGSGIADILVAAGVVVEGSVDQALKGKHYRRGIRCIMLMRETLIHMRLMEIQAYDKLSEDIQENLQILRCTLTETQQVLKEANFSLEDDKDILEIVQRVYNKPGTAMGDFWVSYLEMTDALVQNIHACHARNANEYISSTYSMLPGLRAYDNHEYARWLPDYWAMLSSLPNEQMSFFSDHFAQSMTGLPYSCQPLDLWIETTMNLNSKLKQGWLQLLANEKQLFSTTRNVNNIARVKAAVTSNLKHKNRHRTHTECQPARMKKDEQAVHDILGCMKEFQAEPFDSSRPTLRSLQSGQVASQKCVDDLSSALDDGKAQVDTFLQERVFTKTKPITSTITRNKRITFATDQIQVSSSSQMNVMQMEKSGLVALIELAEGSGLIQLESALMGRVTEECLSMYNVDGSMRKTAKSKLLELFNLEPIPQKPIGFVSLVDMGLIWRLATPTAEDREGRKRDGIEYQWHDYLEKICSIILSRHADAHLIILVNDKYDLPFSIKDDEHDRRAAKYSNIPNLFPKPSDEFPSAVDFNQIMTSSSNKVRLQKLVKQHLQGKIENVQTSIIYCEGDTSTNLSTGTVSGDYVFKHPEADTMIFAAYATLRAGTCTEPVVVDSEDTDVYVQAAYVAHHLRGDLFLKRKEALIDCRLMLPDNVVDIIIPLHILTGSDHTSAFYGHGKKSIMQKVVKDPEARELLKHVGEKLELEERVRSDMKAFVLSAVYGEKAELSCGQARAAKWHQLRKKSTMRLPPDEDSLNLHLKRSNYISHCQLNFHLKEHPSPIGHGWECVNGKCRPIRHTLPPLPWPITPYCSNEASDDDSDISECGDSTDSDVDC